MLNLRLRSRGDPPTKGCTTKGRRTCKRLRVAFLAAIVVATVMPTSAAAQVISGEVSSRSPATVTEYRHLEIYIEGQQPYTLLSGENLS